MELLTSLADLSGRVVRFLIVIGVTTFCIIKCIRILRHDFFYEKKRCVIVSIVSLLIAGVSWVFNMGWLRFYLILQLVPLIHSVIFFYMNLLVAKHFDKSQKIKRLNLFFLISFLILYILMPDMPIGNDGGMFFLFGLIHHRMLNIFAIFTSITAFVGHIVLLVMQIAEMDKMKVNFIEKH